jgi:hypothetical protein
MQIRPLALWREKGTHGAKRWLELQACSFSLRRVIAGLVPAIHHATIPIEEFAARWIAGTSPAMTK